MKKIFYFTIALCVGLFLFKLNPTVAKAHTIGPDKKDGGEITYKKWLSLRMSNSSSCPPLPYPYYPYDVNCYSTIGSNDIYACFTQADSILYSISNGKSFVLTPGCPALPNPYYPYDANCYDTRGSNDIYALWYVLHLIDSTLRAGGGGLASCANSTCAYAWDIPFYTVTGDSIIGVGSGGSGLFEYNPVNTLYDVGFLSDTGQLTESLFGSKATSKDRYLVQNKGGNIVEFYPSAGAQDLFLSTGYTIDGSNLLTLITQFTPNTRNIVYVGDVKGDAEIECSYQPGSIGFIELGDLVTNVNNTNTTFDDFNKKVTFSNYHYVALPALAGNSSAPTASIVSGYPAGTTATFAAGSNNLCGQLIITTPAGVGIITGSILVTFSNSLTFAHSCSVSITQNNATLTNTESDFAVDGHTTGWTFNDPGGNITYATTYDFNYIVAGY